MLVVYVIFYNQPSDYLIILDSAAPHTCAMAVTSSGEALYALAGAGAGHGGAGAAILLVRLGPEGTPHSTLLRQESIVPRFLSALRLVSL